MTHTVLLSILLIPVLTLRAQLYDYSEARSNSFAYTVFSDIRYGVGAIEHGEDTLDLFLDAYIPDFVPGKKAAILVMHAGGFVKGDKLNGGVVRFSKEFAELGFACFSIEYRLGPMKPPVYSTGMRVFARKAAIIDGKAALRWIHANADFYNIDTNNVFLYGASAGGIMSLYIAVSDYGFYNSDSDNAPIPEENNPGASMNVAGAMSLSGSLYDDTWLINVGDPPLMVFHGTEDSIVPFKDIPAIHEQAIANNVPIDYYALDGEGHVPSMATVNGKTFNDLALEFILKHLRIEPTSSVFSPVPVRFSFCPNPVSDILTVIPEINSTLNIYTIQGNLLKSCVVVAGENQVQVNDLPSGMYLMGLSGGTGIPAWAWLIRY